MAQDPLTESRAQPRPGPSGPLPLAPREGTVSPGTLLTPGPAAPALPLAAPTRVPSAATAVPTLYADFLARRHFASLDGLRAVGILAVLWHHVLGGPGRFGANLFFLLSGLLVTTILLRERTRTGTIDVRRFRTRRARRLYPLYFAVLLGYVALVWLIEPPGASRTDFFAHLPYFATFTSNLFVTLDGEHVIFYFAWSLAAQEQFYLLWPPLLRRTRRAAWVLGALLVVAYLTRASLLDGPLPPGSAARALVLSVMPALLLGALLAVVLHARAGFEFLQRFLAPRWCAPLLLALALVLWRTREAPEALLHAVLAALAVACVLREDHLLARLLRTRLAVHIGTVSYGIYLLHMLSHNAVERALARLGLPGGVLDFALSALLATALATLSQRHFEQRFLPQDKRVRRA